MMATIVGAGIWEAVSALVAVLGALFAGYKYFAHRERMSAVRTAFREVVDSLGADDDVHRRAGAIMLRRFFDAKTEQGGSGTPYAGEALNVLAATLRNIETGSLQKLLADGLAYAPTLRSADLQKTNLQGAYLGRRGDHCVDLSGADFYRADLTGASLKEATAQRAVFYQARLAKTVMRGADLTGANFYEADLLGANFTGAKLEGASFSRARNIPESIRSHLDERGTYGVSASERAPEPAEPPAVFLSRPGAASMDVRTLVRALKDRLKSEGFHVREIEPVDYATTGAVAEVRRVMADCAGIVVVAVPDLAIRDAQWRTATPQARDIQDVGLCSPWTSLELGVGTGLGLPVLLAVAAGVSTEIFDYSTHEPEFYQIPLTEDHRSRAFRECFDDWCGSVREKHREA